MAGTDFSIHSSLRARSDANAVPNCGMSVPVKVAMIEIDGDTADLQVLARYHTLVHEDDTAGTGIILRSVRGLNTEAVLHAGVQGIITIQSKGTTPANLATLTFLDNTPIGDVTDGSITAHWGEHAANADVSAYCVPAGYGIKVALTTAGYETAVDGDGTGKMLVVVEYMVIPKTITENL